MTETIISTMECDVRDSVLAVVLGSTGKGTYLQLENGMQAFAFFGGLLPGTEVICTIRRLPSEKFSSALVAVDSVISRADAAA